MKLKIFLISVLMICCLYKTNFSQSINNKTVLNIGSIGTDSLQADSLYSLNSTNIAINDTLMLTKLQSGNMANDFLTLDPVTNKVTKRRANSIVGGIINPIQYVNNDATIDGNAAATVVTGTSSITLELPDPASIPIGKSIRISNLGDGDVIVSFNGYIIHTSNGLFIDKIESLTGTNHISIVPNMDNSGYQYLANF